MKTPPDKTITITFHSHQTKDRRMWWRARLTFPPGATGETPLPLAVEDGLGRPVASGVLELAGQRLAVADGSATLLYRDFIAGKHEKGLWLHRKGMLPIPGALTFA